MSDEFPTHRPLQIKVATATRSLRKTDRAAEAMDNEIKQEMLMNEDGGNAGKIRAKVIATMHENMDFEAVRRQYAREEDIRVANQLEGRGHPTWNRVLMARPYIPLQKSRPERPSIGTSGRRMVWWQAGSTLMDRRGTVPPQS